MSTQNGNLNGTVSQNLDDIGSAGVQMTVVDETADAADGRRPSLSSRDSLDPEDEGGNDNPAFEADAEPSPKLVKNGKPDDGKKESKANGAGKENGSRGDVEMVPLNPAPPSQQQQSNNKNPAAPGINGSSGKNKDQTKVALDSMYNDYFRPVNTRRKLLRGEKLYVTRDQRAHSRSWKWFAFWGGVFTFIAAALLTGILAATGIIMSKSEPASFSSPNSLLGNFSSNDTAFVPVELEESNGTAAAISTTTELHVEMTVASDVHLDHDHNQETEFLTTHPTQTTEAHVTVSELGNSLEENALTPSDGELPPESSDPWFVNASATPATVSSMATPSSAATSSSAATTLSEPISTSTATPSSVATPLSFILHATDYGSASTTPGRARSLEEEATLFPAINETLLEEEQNASVSDDPGPASEAVPANATSGEGVSGVFPFDNSSAFENAADSENVTATTEMTDEVTTGEMTDGESSVTADEKMPKGLFHLNDTADSTTTVKGITPDSQPTANSSATGGIATAMIDATTTTEVPITDEMFVPLDGAERPQDHNSTVEFRNSTANSTHAPLAFGESDVTTELAVEERANSTEISVSSDVTESSAATEGDVVSEGDSTSGNATEPTTTAATRSGDGLVTTAMMMTTANASEAAEATTEADISIGNSTSESLSATTAAPAEEEESSPAS